MPTCGTGRILRTTSAYISRNAAVSISLICAVFLAADITALSASENNGEPLIDVDQRQRPRPLEQHREIIGTPGAKPAPSLSAPLGRQSMPPRHSSIAHSRDEQNSMMRGQMQMPRLVQGIMLPTPTHQVIIPEPTHRIIEVEPLSRDVLREAPGQPYVTAEPLRTMRGTQEPRRERMMQRPPSPPRRPAPDR